MPRDEQPATPVAAATAFSFAHEAMGRRLGLPGGARSGACGRLRVAAGIWVARADLGWAFRLI